MHDTWPLLRASDFPALTRGRLDTLQLNLGYRCNLSCIHCHVAAGPHRTETMERETMELALRAAARHGVATLDLTGGSPEMNPHFRWLVAAARAANLHVIDRLNPTIMEYAGEAGEEPYGWVGPFLAAHRVEVVASLPCYGEANVDAQRGAGAFAASIRGLRALNGLGYGQRGSGLVLNLVYNANGAFLPPPQASLEADYKRLLAERFGIVFDRLYALVNMPIRRFGSWLVSEGRFADYLRVLRDAHADANLARVMCRSLLSVDYQGHLYDCDFNQMLHLPSGGHRSDGTRPHLRDLLTGELPRAVATAGHCFGCTAGQGSSCGGALDRTPLAISASNGRN
jgi:radical SAM/Cys-rich protein